LDGSRRPGAAGALLKKSLEDSFSLELVPSLSLFRAGVGFVAQKVLSFEHSGLISVLKSSRNSNLIRFFLDPENFVYTL
jgi:hypothetical protein